MGRAEAQDMQRLDVVRATGVQGRKNVHGLGEWREVRTAALLFLLNTRRDTPLLRSKLILEMCCIPVLCGTHCLMFAAAGVGGGACSLL